MAFLVTCSLYLSPYSLSLLTGASKLFLFFWIKPLSQMGQTDADDVRAPMALPFPDPEATEDGEGEKA